MIITSITKHETKHENGYWKGRASEGDDRFIWHFTGGGDLCILKKELGYETTDGREFFGVIRRAKDFPVGAREAIVAAIAAAIEDVAVPA